MRAAQEQTTPEELAATRTAAPPRPLTAVGVFWAVFLALCAFCAVVAIGNAVWSGIKEDLAARREIAVAEAGSKISAGFMDSAQKAATLVRAEHAGALVGWEALKPNHVAAEAAINELGSLSKTSHEITIWEALERHESGFWMCAETALNPLYAGGKLSDCEKEYPASALDEALK
jgi:hypothetical protein